MANAFQTDRINFHAKNIGTHSHDLIGVSVAGSGSIERSAPPRSRRARLNSTQDRSDSSFRFRLSGLFCGFTAMSPLRIRRDFRLQ